MSLPPDVQQSVETAIKVLEEKKKLTGEISKADERKFVEAHGVELVSGVLEALFQTANPSEVPLTELVLVDGVPHARVDPMVLLGDLVQGTDEE